MTRVWSTGHKTNLCISLLCITPTNHCWIDWYSVEEFNLGEEKRGRLSVTTGLWPIPMEPESGSSPPRNPSQVLSMNFTFSSLSFPFRLRLLFNIKSIKRLDWSSAVIWIDLWCFYVALQSMLQSFTYRENGRIALMVGVIAETLNQFAPS